MLLSSSTSIDSLKPLPFCLRTAVTVDLSLEGLASPAWASLISSSMLAMASLLWACRGHRGVEPSSLTRDPRSPKPVYAFSLVHLATSRFELLLSTTMATFDE